MYFFFHFHGAQTTIKVMKTGARGLEKFSEVLVQNWEKLQTLLELSGLTGGKPASG